MSSNNLTVSTAFVRTISNENMEILKRLAFEKEPNWFKDALQDQDVFFALRDNRVDAYANGALIHSIRFQKGKAVPYSHVKYLIKEPKKGKEYISLQDGEFNYDPRKVMQTSYTPNETLNQIKKSALYYSPQSSESYGVSKVIAANNSVIDIELSINNSLQIPENAPPVAPETEQTETGTRTKHDRIDIVNLKQDKDRYLIQFWEAKLYANNELFNDSIISQIRRYEKQVIKHRNYIIEAYKKVCRFQYEIAKLRQYTDISQKLCRIAEGAAELEIDTKPHLLVFTYDGKQKERLNRRIIEIRDLLGSAHTIITNGKPSNIILK